MKVVKATSACLFAASITLVSCGAQQNVDETDAQNGSIGDKLSERPSYFAPSTTDSDADGVPNSEDNCPNSPTGAKVFTRADVTSGRVTAKFVGCASNGDVMKPIGSGSENPTPSPAPGPTPTPQPPEESINNLTVGSLLSFKNDIVVGPGNNLLQIFLENRMPPVPSAYNKDFGGTCYIKMAMPLASQSVIKTGAKWKILSFQQMPVRVKRDAEETWGVTEVEWAYTKIEIEAVVSQTRAALICVDEDRGYVVKTVHEVIGGDFTPIVVGGRDLIIEKSIWSKHISLDFLRRAFDIELAPKPELPVIE